MNQHYVQPSYGKQSFNCPHCIAFSQQEWYEALIERGSFRFNGNLRLVREDAFKDKVNGFLVDNAVAISVCLHCDEPAYWNKGEMVYPLIITAPLPNLDMPKDVMDIYNEAREVSQLSPTASTALLRLGLEKLLPQVGAKKAKIDAMIGELVGKGLSKEVEKALDSLRVIGNEAVHPGTLDLNDNKEVAFALFKLLNVIVDRMITQQKEIDEIYNLIPEEKLKGINNRNKRVQTP